MTFYFFDLETSGFSAKYDRIMQFAGQRTDLDLKPIGQPDNILVKIAPDILPQPDAVLLHGITPQKTIADGISEAELAKHLIGRVFTKGTIAVGYNNIRFDNDFLRFLFWRNFTDAYEWCWKDDCSSWDLLDVVRMTRALRPEGIAWPFASDGKPSNKLELLSSLNGLDHADVHDALGDVKAAIALAGLLKQKQPKLFEFLLAMRHKKKVAALVSSGRPLVYTSSRYPSEFNKTTIAVGVAQKDDRSGALMYDLRIDPGEFINLSPTQLAKRWAARGPDVAYFPIKTLSYNKCPAVAPIEVLEKDDGYEHLQLHKELIKDHLKKLQQAKGFADNLLDALEIMWPKRQNALLPSAHEVDGLLYESFVKDEDKTKMAALRAASPTQIGDIKFNDDRLNRLLPLYKARNYPKLLTDQEQKDWADFRRQKLVAGGQADRYYKRLAELAATPGLEAQKKYLLEELKLYAKSVIPTD